jgi:hypothetical protein
MKNRLASLALALACAFLLQAILSVLAQGAPMTGGSEPMLSIA